MADMADAVDAGAWNEPSPVLSVDGFEGPLDWLLEMARTARLDLKRLSILALVEAFAAAMEAALTPGLPTPELARWAGWTVMAIQLTELRSRLLLPAEAPQGQTARSEAETLRQHWISRAGMATATDWLEQRLQLGRDVFARGRLEPDGRGERARPDDDPGDEAGSLASAGSDDLTGLLRACLVALRMPTHTELYQPRPLPFWTVSDATKRISQLLPELPGGAALEGLVPDLAEQGAGRALHRRAALAATLVAGLELARAGVVTLEQDTAWRPVLVA